MCSIPFLLREWDYSVAASTLYPLDLCRASSLCVGLGRGTFAVSEPCHIVRGADVDIVCPQLIVQLTGDRVGLTDFLGLQAFALEHVIEVCVATHIELHRAL